MPRKRDEFFFCTVIGGVGCFACLLLIVLVVIAILSREPAKKVNIVRAHDIRITPVEWANAMGDIELSSDSFAGPHEFDVVVRATRNLYRVSTHEEKRASPLLRQDLVDLQDFLSVDDGILVIHGTRLGSINEDARLEHEVALPHRGLRFAEVDRFERNRSDRVSAFLLFGGHKPGAVYRVTARGTHAKVVEASRRITAAAGCRDDVYFATGSEIYLTRPGNRPVVEYVLPAAIADRSILSMIPVAYEATAPTYAKCTIYFSTGDAVYEHSRGVARLILGGVGGVLRTDRFGGVWLYDRKQRALMQISVERPAT